MKIFGFMAAGKTNPIKAKFPTPKGVEKNTEVRIQNTEARWSAHIHMIRHEDKIWMFNERGELIISKLAPERFYEISRVKIIEPTEGQLDQRGGVCWAHPAFANKHIYVRNDQELLCIDLSIRE